jgi:hypothetical protein
MKKLFPLFLVLISTLLFTGCFDSPTDDDDNSDDQTQAPTGGLDSEEVSETDSTIAYGDTIRIDFAAEAGEKYVVNVGEDNKSYSNNLTYYVVDEDGDIVADVYAGGFTAPASGTYTVVVINNSDYSDDYSDVDAVITVEKMEEIEDDLSGIWYLSSEDYSYNGSSSNETYTSIAVTNDIIEIVGDTIISHYVDTYYDYSYDDESGESTYGEEVVDLYSDTSYLYDSWLFTDVDYNLNGDKLSFSLDVLGFSMNMTYSKYSGDLSDVDFETANSSTISSVPTNMIGTWYVSSEGGSWIGEDENGDWIKESESESYSSADKSDEIIEITEDSVFIMYKDNYGLLIEIGSYSVDALNYWVIEEGSVSDGSLIVEEVYGGEYYKVEYKKYTGTDLPDSWKETFTVTIPSTSNSISLDEVESGTISSEGDVVWYSFTAPSTGGYYFEISESDFETELSLVDASGEVLEYYSSAYSYSYDNLSGIEYECSADETYYVVAGGYGGYSTGSYSLTVSEYSYEDDDYYYDDYYYGDDTGGGTVYYTSHVVRSAVRSRAKQAPKTKATKRDKRERKSVLYKR